LSNDKVDPNWQRVTGRVADFETHQSDSINEPDTSSFQDDRRSYAAIVHYTVDDQQYEVVGQSVDTRPVIGASSEVIYDPAEPKNARLAADANMSKISAIAAPIIGAIVIIVGIIGFIQGRRRKRTITDLTQSGNKVQGVIVDIQTTAISTTTTTAGRSNTPARPQYVIVVAAPDGQGNVRNYTSDTFEGLGRMAVVDFRTTKIPIDVYIDPTNPEKFFVDTSSIPGLTTENIATAIQQPAIQFVPNNNPTAPNSVTGQQIPSVPTPSVSDDSQRSPTPLNQ
jgi:hypothetical protein